MTIGEVSKKLNIPIATLRFYDSEGLLLNVKRDEAGIRHFDEANIASLRLIECLKQSGMQLKEIKEFMNWCAIGDSTLNLRKEMFIKQKSSIEAKISELKGALSLIEYKCWYYDEALRDGNESRVKNMKLDEIPEDIRAKYCGFNS